MQIATTTLMPIADLDSEGKFNDNFYLGLYYYDSMYVHSVEPYGIKYSDGREETITKVINKDNSYTLFKVSPLDFYKYIALLHGSIGLTFIDACRKVDNVVVNALERTMKIQRNDTTTTTSSLI